MYTVLYVDDEPDLLEISKLFLEQSGQFSVDILPSAPEALAAMKVKTYDAIVSDYQMPGMDGIDFLKNVRALGDTIPFILFTGRGREEVVIQALNEGADFYLQKGGDPTAQFTELENKIRYAVTRRRAEASLKRNEAQLRQIIDLVPHMIFANDADGNFILVNRAVAQSYEKQVEDVEGKPQALFQQVPAELERMLADNREVLSTGKTRFIPEETYTDRFGEKRYLQTTKVPFTTLGNHEHAVLGVAVDITERKRAQEALLEREVQLNNSLDLAHLVTWEVNDQTNMFTLNDRFYALYGTNAAREGGYTMPADVYVREFVHPDDVGLVLKEAQKTQKNRDPHYKSQFEHRIIRRDGAIRHITVLTEKITGDDGVTTQTHGVNQDITKRKEAEEALRESEEKYRLLTEKASEIIVIAQDERIVYANPRFSEVLLVPEKDVIGKPFVDFVWPQDRELVRNRYLKRIIGETGAERYDFRLIDQKGKLIWGSVSAVRIQWKGKPATLSMMTDISERKRAKEALEKRLFALMQPLETTEIAFDDLFNLDEIQRLQDEFANATGVASLITRPDGTPITKPSNFTRLCNDIIRTTGKGCANCYRSDSVIGRPHPEGPVVQPCLSGGLWDAGASIFVGGRHIASWLIGQVRNETQAEDAMRAYAREIGADEQTFMSAFYEVPSMSSAQFEAIANSLFTLANQLSRSAYQNVQQARFITEHRQVEDALRESEEKYRLVVEDSRDAIYIHQSDRLLFVNRQASVLTGYSHEELTSIRLWDLVHPDDREILIRNNRDRLAGTPPPHEFTARLLTKDGTSRTCEFVVDTVMYHGSPAIMGIARDITERRKTEEALASANMKLKLLSGISRHDIRNQLTILEGHLAFMKKKEPDSPFLEHFEKMSAAARRIASIIQFTKEYEDIGIRAPAWQDCRTTGPFRAGPGKKRSPPRDGGVCRPAHCQGVLQLDG